VEVNDLTVAQSPVTLRCKLNQQNTSASRWLCGQVACLCRVFLGGIHEKPADNRFSNPIPVLAATHKVQLVAEEGI
jgi:hypothetical protein